jgi:hypothetical protein
MVMLEEQKVPKVSASLRWNLGVLTLKTLQSKAVIECKDQHNFLGNKGFPIKVDGYPMGTHRVSESGKSHHNAFQKMQCSCMQTFCFP